MLPRLSLAGLLLLAACQQGSGTTASTPAPMLLAAGLEQLAPQANPVLQPNWDLARLGIGHVDTVYQLTTPAGTPFRFDVLSRSADNQGSARVSVAHVAADGQSPIDSAVTLARAGCVPIATGLQNRDTWLDAFGDGFARCTIAGAIDVPQVLAFEAANATGTTMALVQIEIGPASPINRAVTTLTDDPAVASRRTLYSSDAWGFGLPAIAVSGDRTSIVVYEGDRAAWQAPVRYELRLQHEAATGTVTGGGSTIANPDSGNWRDHQIAALYNVLAVVHCTETSTSVALSFDRGASFAQTAPLGAGQAMRLAQMAMAADYTLAVTFWQSGGFTGGTDLMYSEGHPVAFAANGSPTWYQFTLPVRLHHVDADAAPEFTGMQWSTGGDLAVAYGYTVFTMHADFTWTSTTTTRCAVRPYGGQFRDTEVDAEELVGRDPSVALLGQDQALRLFVAYESTQGLRLRSSSDAGASYGARQLIAGRGAHAPRVFARQVGNAVRLDVLYLAETSAGTELHRTVWQDYPNSVPQDYRITTAHTEPSAGATDPRIYLPQYGPPQFGLRITQVAWLGYDAVIDGNQLAVVVDEESFDGGFVCMSGWNNSSTLGNGGLHPNASQFHAVTPPPLAPGMQLALPAPDPAHRHQLKMLRID